MKGSTFKHALLISAAAVLALTLVTSTLALNLNELSANLFLATIAFVVAAGVCLKSKLSELNENSFLIILIGSLMVVTSICSCIKIRQLGKNFSFEEAKKMEQRINDLENYYSATETLLDSIGITPDDPILESDAGSHYLLEKSIVDECPD